MRAVSLIKVTTKIVNDENIEDKEENFDEETPDGQDKVSDSNELEINSEDN